MANAPHPVQPAAARHLIVNADDLGHSPMINAGIFEAHRRGIISSATLMVNLPDALEIPAALADHPNLGVGLHFNLCRGEPVAPRGDVPSLLGAGGEFIHDPDVAVARASVAQIAIELRAQLDRFHQLIGRLPTHCDAHKHINRYPAVLEVLLTESERLGLPLRGQTPEIRAALAAAAAPHPAEFLGSLFLDGNSIAPAWSVATLIEAIDGIQPGWTELMCHPGHSSPTDEAATSYSWQRREELEALCAPEVRETIDRRCISLSTFADLRRAWTTPDENDSDAAQT